MPYKIVREPKGYAVKNIKTGKLHGYTTEEKAKAQLRLLQALQRGEHYS